MISIEGLISQKIPAYNKLPKPVAKKTSSFLKRLLYEDKINDFLAKHGDLKGVDFIDEALEAMQISFRLRHKDLEKIPASGRVIIIANHPLGSWDALILIKVITSVRPDVKIVANELLTAFAPLSEFFIPIDVLGGHTGKEAYKAMLGALKQEKALIIFPAGEVSRLRPVGVRDTKWKSGFLKLAQKSKSPILPICIGGRNSWLFYTISAIHKPISQLLLAYEMFNKAGKTIDLTIGNLIPFKNLGFTLLDRKSQLKLLRKHLYHLKDGKRSIFTTECSIALPVERRLLKEELRRCELLGRTSDNKMIYLYDSTSTSPLLMEIGRLREVTFRQVGEGSGRRRDLDQFDRYYKHILVWDDDQLEIVGSYRIGIASEIIELAGVEGLYTTTLFDFSKEFFPYLHQAIELGRSFVQPAYWGSRALDYLWQGIGAFLASRPQIRYMFGPVSISGAIPEEAQKALVWFYKNYFGSKMIVRSKNPFTLTPDEQKRFSSIFSGQEYAQDLRILKEYLRCMGTTIPTLFKHYTELTEPSGVSFLDFGIDPDFGNCIDGFIIVDVSKILESKRRRYMSSAMNNVSSHPL